MRLRPDQWKAHQQRTAITVRVPTVDGRLEEHQYLGRLIEEHCGYVIIDAAVVVKGARNGQDLPLPGKVWLRRETIVHMQQPGAST